MKEDIISFKNIKNKYLKKLLRDFDAAAQYHDWQRGQGTYDDAKDALLMYQVYKKRLVNYLNKKMPK